MDLLDVVGQMHHSVPAEMQYTAQSMQLFNYFVIGDDLPHVAHPSVHQ
jgi:hypothetical protein